MEKSSKSKEVLHTKLETQEKNKDAKDQTQREKLNEMLSRVERAHSEVEIRTEAARVATACTLQAKLTKAQEERERQEQELKHRLEEKNKHAEMVRKNKEKIQAEGDIGPESA